ncbi:MAG: hypothetical protein ACYDDN_09665 [Candidatus Desulforudaceae bacterium]|jgi:predicted RNase H-like HicB family nuclease|nr:hypothetical protein [Desulforudis sp.]MDZ7609667.1 hypothetical protein [Eubacteriales bacterium]
MKGLRSMAGHSRITPDADAEYEVIVTGDGKHFVATCKGYPVFAQGETREETLENLREAMALYFDDLPISLPATVIKTLTDAGFFGVNKRGRHIRFRRYGENSETLIIPNTAEVADSIIDHIQRITGNSTSRSS